LSDVRYKTLVFQFVTKLSFFVIEGDIEMVFLR